MKQKKKQIFIISGVILVLVALLGVAAWFITRPEAQIENVTKDELNVEWYDENEKEFTLTTAEELFEFAQLSSYYNFKGQTIKLGADIVVNEGDASEWGTTFPEKVWDKPIDSFAGTFDGQGHTISGIYCMGYLYKCSGKGLKPLPAGLFSNTKPECVIKNFRLVNSYFEGDLQDGAGTISACGGGTFDSIYSDATLISYKYWNGGIIGKATESTTITNCWFDGDIQVIGGYARYTAGIMGRAMNKEADFLIEHCLVTGTMYNETEKTGVAMGAILGNALDSAIVTINDCFVDAELTNEYKVAVGSVYGVSEQNATVNVTNTYATTESYERMVGAVLGIANGMPVGYEREMLKGNGGYQWTSLDFDKYWSVVEDGTPILTTFADKTPSLEGVERYVDLSWYTDEATEYVLLDKADLYGFSLLTQSWDFKDKTIKLGADITVNEGKASDWAKQAPALEWISAGPKSKPFAGTFNGQMHTISGIYLDSDVMNTGLFSVTAEESTIKNLKLKNSYFKSEASFTGSIVGQGRGKIDTVYSDATVIASKGGIGGFVGLSYGEKGSVKNCWFAGTVINASNLTGERGTGGIIGTVYDEASVKVENCLNTGTVDVRAYTFNQAKEGKAKNVTPIAGGIVGWVRKKTSSLDMKDCLNTGKVLVSNAATGGYGSILGYSDGDTTIEHTYATTESSALTAAKIKGWVLAYEEAKLIGYEGYRWTTLNFDKYWSVMEKGTPVLTSFAGKGMSTSGVARMVDTSWYDAKKDTYVLTDAADLYGFAYLANGTDFAKKTIQLGADITLNSGNAADWVKTAPALVWRPIASKNLPFAGTFDGQMHTISGIYVNSDERNSGLFSATGETSVVKNLKLTNSYLTSTAGELGSIAGQGRGTFDTVYSEAIVVGNSANIGGLVGMGYVGEEVDDQVVMKKCWFNGTVTNSSNDKANRGTGGLIGTLYDGTHATLENCLNTGVVDVTAYQFDQDEKEGNQIYPLAGGLVGWVKNSTKEPILKSSVDIKYCLSTKEISVSSTANGCYGSVVGYSDNVPETKVTKTYSTVNPIGNVVTGGVTQFSEDMLTGQNGYQWTLLDFKNSWAIVETGTPILKAFASVVPSITVERMVDIGWYDKADGSKKDPYKISDEKELYGLSALSVETDFAGKIITLADDIVVNVGNANEWNASHAPAYKWIPIASKDLPFAGTFDGQMHTISGIYVNADERNSGLFSATGETSVVENLKLTNSYLTSTAGDLGSIAGQGRGTFDTVYSEAIIVGNSANIGGLVGMGYGEKVVMEKCWFNGTVTNTATHKNNRGTGGLIGTLYDGSHAEIKGCLNSGTVDVTEYEFDQNADDSTKKPNITPIAGGLVGWVKTDKSSVNIYNCLNTKEVLAHEDATGGYGAIVGLSENKNETVVSVTYSTTSPLAGSKVNGIIYQKTEEEITGYKGYQWTLLNFDKYWAVVEESTPIVKTFAKKAPTVAETDRMIDLSWIDKATGTSEDPYKLYDKEDLYGFAMLSTDPNYEGFKGKTIRIEAELIEVNTGDMSGWDEWTPIGSEAVPFKGTFDGGMATISGIYVNADARNSGFFAVTGEGSVVKNLKLTSSRFESTAGELGSIAGQGRGTFDTIYSEAIVVGNGSNIGGLVGKGFVDEEINDQVVMKKCWFAGTVTNSSNDKANRGTGGLIGTLYDGTHATLENCLNTGIVDVTAYQFDQGDAKTKKVWPLAGGLVGWVKKSSTQPEQKSSVDIKYCLSTKAISVASVANGNYGSVVGYSDNVPETKVTKTYSTVSLIGNVVTGGVTQFSEDMLTGQNGYQWTLLDFKNTWAIVETGTPILKAFASVVPSITVERMVDIGWYDKADGSKTNPYKISDEKELYGLSALSVEIDFAGKIITLTDDIEVNEGNANEWNANNAPAYKWIPIGSKGLPFAGIFDGDMHTISGIYLNSNTVNSGLFSVTDDESTVKNLKLKNSYITSTQNALGSIVGQGRGLLEAVYSEAIVVGSKAQIGGLVGLGYDTNLHLKQCWFAGVVTNKGNAQANRGTGGLIGIMYTGGSALVENCLNTGIVDVTAYAYNQGKNGAINIAPMAGALVGWGEPNASVTINKCLNTGELLVNAKATGFYSLVIGCKGGSVPCSNNYATVPTQWTDAIASKAAYTTSYATVTVNNITGDKAETTLAQLDFVNTWTCVPYTTPVLEVFESEVIDTSWYVGHESDTTFTLKDRADLYGFAVLSQTNNFKDKIIELGADIVVNVGEAEDWSNGAPSFKWLPIGYVDTAFAGEFDGKMNTISGIYCNRTSDNAGLFGYINSNKEDAIRNFKLMNSYIKNTARRTGSIAGRVDNGEFTTIYSNAYVESSREYAGGLVGMAYQAKFAMDRCWFNGTVKNTATNDTTATRNYRGVGGLVGSVIGQPSSGEIHLTNCLNSGTVKAENSTQPVPKAGGFTGSVEGGAILNITSCLNVGDVDVADGKLCGIITGLIDNATVNCNTSYGYDGGNNYAVGYIQNNGKFKISTLSNGNVINVERGHQAVVPVITTQRTFTGKDAETSLEGFVFPNVWKSTDTTPVLNDLAK